MASYTSGSPGAGQLEIGIALVLQDRFSNQAREASGVIKKLHNDAKMAVNANAIALQGIANGVSSFAMGMAGTLSDIVIEGAEFVDTMTTVSAITEATDAQLKKLSDTAQTLGLQTMFDSKEIASGMKYLAMAGNSAKEIDDMIRGAAFVAGATGMELGGKGGTADLITNIMRTFKIEASEAAGVVGDQLTKAALSSNISMMDLAESLKYAAADMVTLKQELPQVAAMIGTLGNAGIQGSMAGTALSNMVRYLNKSISQPSFKGGKALARLGLSKQDFVDAKGDLLDFSIILEKLQKATANLTSTEQNAVFLDIFGVRGNRAAVALMRDLDGYRELLGKIVNDSQGFAESVVEKRMNTIAGSLDIMRSSLENLRTTFTEAVEPFLSPIFKGIGIVVGWLRDILATPVLGTLISSVITIGTALLTVGSALTIIRTKWVLLKNDSQITSRGMFSVLIGGWNGATLSAKRYLDMERAIISQRKAGILSNTTASVMQATGVPIGGIRYNKAGIPIDAKTGRFVNRKVASDTIRNTSASTLTRSIMGGTIAATAGRGLVRNIAANGLGKVLLGFGSKLLGFLGGPIGIAIMGVSTILPMILSGLRKNSESLEENTTSAYTLADRYKSESDKQKNGKDLTLTQEVRMLYNAMMYWAEQLPKIKPTSHVTINVDGKKGVREMITEDNEDINLSLATK